MGGTSKSAKIDKNYRANRPRKRRFAGNQFVDRNRNSKGEASSSAQKIKTERSAQGTSSTAVETVQKNLRTEQTGPVLPLFKSDASKVTSEGMGLEKAYIGKQNQFTVNASDAGNNILFVGVYGPEGPCEEMSMKHTGRNNYNLSYVVRERGEHIVIVKWGDEHIPGSPYKVEM